MGQMKEKIKVTVGKLVDTMTPQQLMIYKQIRERYELEVGNRPNRDPGSLSSEERLMARISRLSYLFSQDDDRNRSGDMIDGYQLVPELSDDNSVVVYKGSVAIIGFRGTVPTKSSDLVADYHVALGTTAESRRFREAEEKFQRVRATAKYGVIKVTGHSLGGAQAVHVAKIYHVDCWAWNPGQGVSETYLLDKMVYPNIRTYHISGDPISNISGLENPSSVYIFPQISQLNPLTNHTLDNFLL